MVLIQTCLFVEPLDLAAVLPLTLLGNAFLADVGADAVLFSCFPFADILAAISPNEGTLTLTLIVNELASVCLAVLPFEFAFAIHFVLAPVARIGFAIRPVIVAEPTDLVVLEGAFVVAAIGKGKSTLTFFLAIFVVSFISGTIGP